jgi:hypothetical protein
LAALFVRRSAWMRERFESRCWQLCFVIVIPFGHRQAGALDRRGNGCRVQFLGGGARRERRAR